MGFDTAKFLNNKFQRRKKNVPVPDLKKFFPDDSKKDDHVWVVHGLTGQELGHCKAAAARNRNMGAVLEGIASGQTEEIKKAISQIAGGPNVPDDIATRIAMLEKGSVDPICDETLAVHLCTYFPIEFYQLTTEINVLTGMGHEPGK